MFQLQKERIGGERGEDKERGRGKKRGRERRKEEEGGEGGKEKGGREKKLNLPSSAFLFHLALKQVRWCLLL